MSKRTDIKYVFAGRLRLSRRAKGWSRPEMERITGISQNTIRQYEDADCLPSAPRLILLAQALDVDPAWLVPVEREDGK
jgi:transcriptional regulator with XRE-family HTH domain